MALTDYSAATGDPLSLTLNLGTSECEDCGYDRESLTVEYADGDYRFQLSVGCYGGEHYRTADKPDFLDALGRQGPYLHRVSPKHTTDFQQLIRAVANFQEPAR